MKLITFSCLASLALATFVLTGSSGYSQTPTPAGTLLSFDFETKVWPDLTAAAVGTIDVAGSAQPSAGLRGAKIVSGPLPIRNAETNLGKLTLAFSLAASAARPVTVRVESFDAGQQRTGGLETTIYPAAPDFYQRYALDLSTFKASGAGKFQADAPFVGFSFEMGGEWNGVARPEIRLDNVNYATPAYYVSAQGDDKNDGRSETTAFATPQKALNVAGPGDIVVLMEGTYQGGLGSVASFPRAGTPAAWIVLKNYPGATPRLTSTGWNIVSIAKGSKQNPSDAPSLAYLEVRGLHVRGASDVAREKFPEAIGKADGRSNGNGIAVDGRYMKNLPHHIRLADNLVEYCPGQGLGALESDWITIENNVSRYNCWTTIYGTSGISLLGASNFDATDNIYKALIRNNVCHRNETYQPWSAIGRVSDGNGIIIDVNQKTDDRPEGSYLGRTLVQSNLCFDNGGSGIHTVKANRVDIINNTACWNSASKSLEYSQIYTYASDDVRIINNILVAPVADIAAGEKPEPVNRISGKNGKVVFAHNLYFGGNIAPTLGDGDRIADPQFVNPSRDPKVADFHLKAGSPAIGAGRVQAFSPFLDLDGKPRRAAPTIGAYEK
ncbi:MAG: right-handed parallel beta-helix repeat-containing protein [Armatimonadota bacterium]|nr:right-handed parallel beta-helix repeat-containing protein [Armatimonadota bacterium]